MGRQHAFTERLSSSPAPNLPTLAQVAAAERNRFTDAFLGVAETPLPEHEPELSSLAGGWRNENGALMLSGAQEALVDPSVATRQGDSRHIATLPVGTLDVEIEMIASDVSSVFGAVLSFQDAQNYLAAGWGPAGGSPVFVFYEMEANETTSYTTAGDLSAGDRLLASAVGDTVALYRNGEHVAEHTSSLLGQATRHGLFASGNAAVGRFAIRK